VALRKRSHTRLRRCGRSKMSRMVCAACHPAFSPGTNAASMGWAASSDVTSTRASCSHVEPLRVGARELLGSRADHTLPHGSLLSCTVSRRSRPHATSSVHGLLKPSAGSRDSTAAQAPQPRALSSRSRTVYGLSAAALPRARSLGGSSAGPHPTLRANGCRAERGHAPGGMTPRAPRKTRHPWPGTVKDQGTH
jgi:ribosomal protein L37E